MENEPVITPAELTRRLEKNAKLKVFDVRRVEDRVDVDHPVPTAEWRNPEQVEDWSREIDAGEEVIVFCVKGQHVGVATRDALRAKGIDAKSLEGGLRAWGEYRRQTRERWGGRRLPSSPLLNARETLTPASSW